MYKISNTHYYVEGLESDNVYRIIPHTVKTNQAPSQGAYKFLDRSEAKGWRSELKENYPEMSFRLVKVTETVTYEDPV